MEDNYTTIFFLFFLNMGILMNQISKSGVILVISSNKSLNKKAWKNLFPKFILCALILIYSCRTCTDIFILSSYITNFKPSALFCHNIITIMENFKTRHCSQLVSPRKPTLMAPNLPAICLSNMSPPCASRIVAAPFSILFVLNFRTGFVSHFLQKNGPLNHI